MENYPDGGGDQWGVMGNFLAILVNYNKKSCRLTYGFLWSWGGVHESPLKFACLWTDTHMFARGSNSSATPHPHIRRKRKLPALPHTGTQAEGSSHVERNEVFPTWYSHSPSPHSPFLPAHLLPVTKRKCDVLKLGTSPAGPIRVCS